MNIMNSTLLPLRRLALAAALCVLAFPACAADLGAQPRGNTYWRIDCSRRTITVLDGADYDAHGNVIGSVDPQYPEMAYIAPGSIGEELYRAVCPLRHH